MKRGNVVLFVAQGDMGKPRPGVVVQADELGEATTSVLICPMSSDMTEIRRTRPVIGPTESNGLRLPSHVMTDKLLALRRDRVRQVIGSLEDESIERLNTALLVVLGLAE